MKLSRRLFLLLVTASLIVLPSCRRATDTIKVGEYASLTGKEASFGQSSHKGIVLAIEARDRSIPLGQILAAPVVGEVVSLR